MAKMMSFFESTCPVAIHPDLSAVLLVALTPLHVQAKSESHCQQLQAICELVAYSTLEQRGCALVAGAFIIRGEAANPSQLWSRRRVHSNRKEGRYMRGRRLQELTLRLS